MRKKNKVVFVSAGCIICLVSLFFLRHLLMLLQVFQAVGLVKKINFSEELFMLSSMCISSL